MQSLIPLFIFFGVLLALEFYGWNAFKTAFQLPANKRITVLYWGTTIFLYVLFFAYRPLLYRYMPHWLSVYFPMFMLLVVVTKLITVFFLLPEDIWRGGQYVASKFSGNGSTNGISRSIFLSKMALYSAAVPVGTLVYGMVANAYNYRFKKITLRFPNLPDAFNGFRLVHITDIHTGSFTRTEPVLRAVEQINNLNADAIFFTGDLVNNIAAEMDDFKEIFAQLSAKHGVFSITGNHDYGDYVEWQSDEEKKANFERFKAIHKEMGWDLLMNENRLLEKDGQKIAILGVENWGTGRWTKYGKLDLAYRGSEEAPFKILLSHNPQHWDAQVRPHYPDIDLTLSGHTHGAQLGVEEKWLRWSPAKYIYKQWMGLYNEGRQYIYVNPGFGFLFYPGRVGILPEVTEITLQKA